MLLRHRFRWTGATRWGMAALLAATTVIAPSWQALAAGSGAPAIPAKGITAGNLVISLCTSDAVREYTPKGRYVQDLITRANGLTMPTGSAFDQQNNLYVTDFAGNQILKRASTGKITIFSTSATLGNGHVYNSPESIALTKDGTKMYISNANRHGAGGGINIVDPKTGKGVGFFALPSSQGFEGQGQSDWLGLDKLGHLYMTNESAAQGLMQVNLKTGDVKQPSLAGNLSTIPYAFGFDKNGNVWLADSTTIREYTITGKLLRSITGPVEAFSAVFDPTASLFYVGDYSNGSVYTYNLTGKLVRTFAIPGDEICGISVYHGFLP